MTRILFLLFCFYVQQSLAQQEKAKASNTKVRFSFTINGRDTCISTKIKIKALDASTNKEKNNEPASLDYSCLILDSIFDIQPGLYQFSLDSTSISSNKIQVKYDTTNYVEFVIEPPTLKFAYIKDSISPFEFDAKIVGYKNKDTLFHPSGSSKIIYSPDRYFVEVNCSPRARFNINLTLGSDYELRLPKPGTLKLIHNKLRGEAKLQTIIGDAFSSFITIEFNETEKEQQLKLQPGPYKLIVETEKGPITISEFRIKSSETTEVDLL